MKIINTIIISLVICCFYSCSSSAPIDPAEITRENRDIAGSVTKVGNLSKLERRITSHVDMQRQAAGLTPMKYDSRLAVMAKSHSAYLANQDTLTGTRVLNHKGKGKRSIRMTSSYSMSRTGENVAYLWGNMGDPAVSFTRNWMNSPHHKKNILSKWNYTGTGVVVAPNGVVYATQLFGY